MSLLFVVALSGLTAWTHPAQVTAQDAGFPYEVLPSTSDQQPPPQESDAARVKQTVRKYQVNIVYCYEAHRKEDPTLEGRVETRFTIQSGRVKQASIVENTTGSEALGDCMTDRIERWRFPVDVDGEFFYPFILILRTDSSVQLGTPALPAGVDPEAFSQALGYYRGRIAHCQWLQSQSSHPHSGRLELEWQVVDGRAQELRVALDTLDNPELTQCVVQRVREIPMPAGVQGRVLQPIEFAPRPPTPEPERRR
ncbi:MAG: AgmX/PglI C-terminal domain-containing protein [Myxococcota bacterium]|nr:AgmX/PglI C-terminal domain-containing protein [Myxococcota bacterium]